MLAGLPDGNVLDLATGLTRHATRDDRLTMTLAATPCEGDAPEFKKFLRYAFADHDDVEVLDAVNALSAGDPIEANAMRQGSVDFRPVCHLLLNGNHAPHISSPGTFRRMRLIPMERIPTEEDDTLERRIVGEEGGSILRMALEARAKRAKPTWGAGVKAAVRTYEIENDKVATWMDECCVIDPGKTVWAATAFANFQNWWTTTGHQHSATMQYFGAKLRDKGFKKDRSAPTPGATRQWYYKGFALEENEF